MYNSKLNEELIDRLGQLKRPSTVKRHLLWHKGGRALSPFFAP